MHLSRASPNMEQKTVEMEALINHSHDTYLDADWIIIGNINWPENICVTRIDNLLEDCGLVVPYGSTFDPLTNPLAAATMQTSTHSQRYDRVYVKGIGGWAVQSTQLFGNGDSPPSDYYGLKVVLECHIAPANIIVELNVTLGAEPQPITLLPPTSKLTTVELVKLFLAQCWIPFAEWEQKMSDVIEMLHSLIFRCSEFSTTNNSNVRIQIECVSSYALGVHTSVSNVDCLAVGNVSSSTFWALMKYQIRQNTKATEKGCNLDIRLRRFIKDAVVQMMNLEVGELKVDLQYCPAKSLVGEELPIVSPPTFKSGHTEYIQRRSHPRSLLSTFWTAHCAVKLFLVIQVSTSGSEELESHHLMRQFFLTYGHWNWERDDAVSAIPPQEVEFSRASNQMGKHRKVFLKQHKVLIKLDINFWVGSNLKGRAVIGWLESRVISLWVQLYTAVPSINVHFWLVHFADVAEIIDSVEDALNLPGFYLFGLSPFFSMSSSKLL
ncbi:hypothetical protein EV359DRAFT_66931 [Lentinula novae-zelandiae]|nr:hypothetical protein EV359DRAFT_66931 [Lentinula novae-zelandiae]